MLMLYCGCKLPPTFSTMPPLPRLLPFSAPRTQASHLPTPSTSPEPTSLPTSPVVENTGIIGRIAADVSVKEEVDELETEIRRKERGVREVRQGSLFFFFNFVCPDTFGRARSLPVPARLHPLDQRHPHV